MSNIKAFDRECENYTLKSATMRIQGGVVSYDKEIQELVDIMDSRGNSVCGHERTRVNAIRIAGERNVILLVIVSNTVREVDAVKRGWRYDAVQIAVAPMNDNVPQGTKLFENSKVMTNIIELAERRCLEQEYCKFGDDCGGRCDKSSLSERISTIICSESKKSTDFPSIALMSGTNMEIWRPLLAPDGWMRVREVKIKF